MPASGVIPHPSSDPTPARESSVTHGTLSQRRENKGKNKGKTKEYTKDKGEENSQGPTSPSPPLSPGCVGRRGGSAAAFLRCRATSTRLTDPVEAWPERSWQYLLASSFCSGGCFPSVAGSGGRLNVALDPAVCAPPSFSLACRMDEAGFPLVRSIHCLHHSRLSALQNRLPPLCPRPPCVP